MRVRGGVNPNPKGLGAESDENLALMASENVTWSHGVRPDVFEASSMALSKEEDTGLVFLVIFGACLGWNVAFVCKGLFDGLSWVEPDELSGLTGKSV